MSAYIARRILLMVPTLLGILFVSFVVVQFAPGGPVERVIAQLSGAGLSKPNCFSRLLKKSGSSPCAPRYFELTASDEAPT